MRNLIFSIGFFVAISLTATTNGSIVIFQDSFSVQPSSNGWSESTTSGATIKVNSMPNGSGPAAVEFENTTGPGSPELFSLTRSISTTGFTDIKLDFSAFQNTDGSFDGSGDNEDFLQVKFSVDGGSNFNSLVQDYGKWNGKDVDRDDGFNDVSTSLFGGPLSLAGAENLADLQIMISARSTGTEERYFLDNIVVTGVPEPTSFLLFGLGMVGLSRRRR